MVLEDQDGAPYPEDVQYAHGLAMIQGHDDSYDDGYADGKRAGNQEGFFDGYDKAFDDLRKEAARMFPTDKRSRDQVDWIIQRIREG